HTRWPRDWSSDVCSSDLEQVFKGGGSTIYAVRVANGDPKAMTWSVEDAAGTPAKLMTLTASSPGSWANGIVVSLTKPANTGDPRSEERRGGKEGQERRSG